MAKSPDQAVFDAHVDALQRALDLGQDLGGASGCGHFDLDRARLGGLGAVVLVAWVDPRFLAEGEGACFARAQALLVEFQALLQRYPGRIRFAGNARGLRQARQEGALAAIAGIEGGHAIEESLARLEWFFEVGVRVLTLVWNNHLSWIRSCQDGAGAGVPPGLSSFGRKVVARMNELGMLVDLSHAGERSFYDALDEATKPLIASHSGCAALHAHPRNLSDDQLRALSRHAGVVGIVFHPGFLDAGARAEEERVRAGSAYRALRGASETELFVAQSQLMARSAAPLATDRLIDHIVHAAEVAGIDHVGVGSDFDGIQRTPQGLEDASCYGRLAEGMLSRGFAISDVRKVLWDNMERAFAAATGPETRAFGAPPMEPASSGFRSAGAA
jgi:membrane dipeptidase